MIELKTNPDYLDQLAADHILDGRDATGSDLKAAALDHKNLQEYAERLERSVNQLSAEISEKSRVLGNAQNAVEQMQNAFIAMVGGAIDARIKDHLEKSEADGDAIRDAIKDMVRDGELSVDVDYSNVELELSISV